MAYYCGNCGRQTDANGRCPVCDGYARPRTQPSQNRTDPRRRSASQRPAGGTRQRPAGSSASSAAHRKPSAGRPQARAGSAGGRSSAGRNARPSAGGSRSRSAASRRRNQNAPYLIVLICVAAVLMVSIITVAVMLISGNKELKDAGVEDTFSLNDTRLLPFEDVIKEYRSVVRAKFYADLKADEKRPQISYANSNLINAANGYITGNPDGEYHVYYALDDLDGDGLQELIIGGGESEDNIVVYDIFAILQNKAQNLFKPDEIGGANTLGVYSDGRFAVLHRSGGEIDSVTYYKHPSKMKKEVSEKYAHDAGLYTHLNTEGQQYKITKDEFDEAVAKVTEDLRLMSWRSVLA
ncbi:MAG: hypothetical protein IJJ85_04560 [Clostridia bacterium]|nr:hypothetical protein [Clostridia bacterium]